MMFLKKCISLKKLYKLVTKVNNIDTSNFVLKTNFDTKFTGLENEIPNTSGLVKKTDYNTKITEIEDKIPGISGLATKATLTTVENKIPSISNLATKTALTTVENKIPSISGLVKKTDDNTKITDIENKVNNHNHDKYVATSEFNTLAADVFNARLAQVNNDLSYYRGKQYFDEGSSKQNYLVFLSIRKYFKLNSVVNAADYVLSWQSNGLSNESIKPPTTSNNSLTPELNYYGTKTRVKFTGSCLKQPSHILTNEKIVNIYIHCL